MWKTCVRSKVTKSNTVSLMSKTGVEITPQNPTPKAREKAKLASITSRPLSQRIFATSLRPWLDSPSKRTGHGQIPVRQWNPTQKALEMHQQP